MFIFLKKWDYSAFKKANPSKCSWFTELPFPPWFIGSFLMFIQVLQRSRPPFFDANAGFWHLDHVGWSSRYQPPHLNGNENRVALLFPPHCITNKLNFNASFSRSLSAVRILFCTRSHAKNLCFASACAADQIEEPLNWPNVQFDPPLLFSCADCTRSSRSTSSVAKE